MDKDYADFAGTFADLYIDQGAIAAGQFALDYFGKDQAERLSGDDGLRRAVAEAFEERGYVVNYPDNVVAPEAEDFGDVDGGATIIPFPASRTIH